MNYKDYTYVNGAMFKEFIISGVEELKKHLDEINDLNVFPIPDGDTGDNMYRTISGGVEKMNKCESDSIGEVSRALADGMLFNARGNSGVILSQLFAGMADGLDGLKEASIEQLYYAFSQGSKRGYSAVITPVEGTILTVAREGIEFSDNKLNKIDSIGKFVDIVLQKMHKSLENTPNLLDILKEAGVIDSGGAGLFMIAQGIKSAIYGNRIEVSDTNFKVQTNNELDFDKFSEDSTLEFGYCTEFLLRLMNAKVDVNAFDEKVIIDYLSSIGDSIVCFKSGSIVKVHVHTFTPSKALEFCQQFGEFLTIKIENMTLQHNEHIENKENKDNLVKKERTKFATLMVADGEGIINLFKELGIDYIIDGGQCNNPSVNDIIEAFDKVNADNIYIFPNNSNIILAAQKAKDLYNDSKVYIVPTKNIGQGYSAISMLDYSSDDPEEIYNIFLENYNFATTAILCKATKPSRLNGLNIVAGDFIGFVDKNIVANGKSIDNTFELLCEKLDIKNREMLTVFYGKEMSDENKGLIKALVEDKFSNLGFYEIEGNQEAFDIIAIIE